MKNILLIEDDPSIQRAMKRSLERSLDGAIVTIAGDAQTAIKIIYAAVTTLGAYHFDHIISDYNLLASTGGDVLDFIKDEGNTLHDFTDQARNILLDRFTFLSDDDKAKAMHNRFIRKPCSIATLIRALDTRGPIVIDV